MRLRTPAEDTPQHVPALFGTWTATYVVVSSMVGVGVLTTSGYTVISVESNALTVCLWALGGLIALCGALSLAEVASALPRSGGEYAILSEAYGRLAGFLGGWTSFLLGFAAPIAAAASASAGYILGPWPHEPLAELLLGTALIVVCTATHALGRRGGAGLQGSVTVLTLALLGVFVAAGLASGAPGIGHMNDWPPLDAGRAQHAITALVYVAFAYTGWNGAAYIAGEVRHPGRSVPRSILAGTGLVVTLYLGMNLVYALALSSGEVIELASREGPDAVKPIAALAAQRLWGSGISGGLSLAFGLALLASLSAQVLTGARVLMAMSIDGLFPAFAGRLAGPGQTPVAATLMLSSLSLGLLWTGSFRALVVFASVGLALSSMGAVAAIFAFRRRRRGRAAPFSSPGFPFVPLFYLAATGVLIGVTLADPVEGPPARWSLAGIAAGVPIHLVLERLRRARA
jgi:APA family basic amino acid/polyamine antiporter